MLFPANRLFQIIGPQANSANQHFVIFDLETFAPSAISKEVEQATQVTVSPDGRFALFDSVVWNLDTMKHHSLHR